MDYESLGRFGRAVADPIERVAVAPPSRPAEDAEPIADTTVADPGNFGRST